MGLKKAGFGVGKLAGFGGGVEPGETIRAAAARELDEEAELKVDEQDIEYMGHVDFVFPAKPSWNQKVYIFLAKTWLGTPTESDEMRPSWFEVSQLPLEQMWQDAALWLPQVLGGHRLFKRFVFASDNETVESMSDVEMSLDL